MFGSLMNVAEFGMATLDDKILDGPSAGYCSSSEDEGTTASASGPSRENASAGEMPSDETARTGPKGVLADYKRFRQTQREQIAVDTEHLLEVANRFALSHKPADDDDEDALESIRRRRLEQLKSMAKGKILEVPSRFEFLSLIENDSRSGSLLFMHIYDDGREQSERLNEALLELAGRFPKMWPRAKFYKVQTKILGTSEKFSRDGLPALQVYRDEQLIGNFVRLTEELGDDYDGAELYRFLQRNGIPLELDVTNAD